MNDLRPWLRAALGVALLLTPIFASVALAQGDPPPAEAASGDEPAAANIEDVIVITASGAEQRLQDAPATMTVISAKELEMLPADDYGDVFRNVPGLNVSQMSARDIQITGRSSTNSLAASELVLLDGRSVYLDFFGFVMWDLLPTNPRDIKQIEVVRGPGSAIWGANALSGVINLITKTPRESQGGSVLLGGGELSTLFASASYAHAGDRAAFKASAGYYEQDPFDRPTGNIPGKTTPYPTFKNQGTKQPKVDLRLDLDQNASSVWTFSAGTAGTDGIIHSGIGPFDINSGTRMSYFKTGWSKNSMRASFFTNILDGDADNLLTLGADGRPLNLTFDSKTYNLDFSNVTLAGSSHIFTYGANARKNEFDLSIAPQGDNRDEYGAYVQDEILFGNSARWLIGGRWDNIDPIGDVFSPRTSLAITPSPDHTFRLSYNRAFKAPSLIQNYLDIVIINAVRLPTGLYVFPSLARGNVDLQEERLDAYELGWVGTFGSTTVSLSVYRNKTKDSQDFFTAGTYTAANPPPNFPLPRFVLAVPPPQGLAGVLPSLFSYRNIGETIDEGAELAVQWRAASPWSWSFNYSYQKDPEVKGIPKDQVNIPPESRANLTLGYDGGHYFGNANVNYQDEAFWTDVLDSRFHGPTDSYTQLNLSLGMRFAGDKVTVSVIGNNVTDERVQQHVFGDIISRKIIGQVLFNW